MTYDVWSLGGVLFFMLSVHIPFREIVPSFLLSPGVIRKNDWKRIPRETHAISKHTIIYRVQARWKLQRSKCKRNWLRKTTLEWRRTSVGKLLWYLTKCRLRMKYLGTFYTMARHFGRKYCGFGDLVSSLRLQLGIGFSDLSQTDVAFRSVLDSFIHSCHG